MVVVCVSLAIGADRVLEWVAADWGGRRQPPASTGWIEER
jgi:hypothetical protein